MSSVEAAKYFRIGDERCWLRTPPDDFIRLAFFKVFLVPVGLVGLATLVYAVAGPRPVVEGIGWGLIGLAGIIGTWGLVQLALAHRRSSQTQVMLDPVERLWERAGNDARVLPRVERVRLERMPMRWTYRLRLIARNHEVIDLLRDVPPTQAPVLLEVADRIAEELRVESEAPEAIRSPRIFGADRPRVFAALCYLPIDGFLVAFSVWALCRHPHPLVRYSAKQSLLLALAESLVAIAIGGCLISPFALFGQAGYGVALAVAPIAIALLARTGLRFFAAYRASRGHLTRVAGLWRLLAPPRPPPPPPA